MHATKNIDRLLDMIDFDIAKAWHKIFTEKLEFIGAGFIEEALPLEHVCDDSACKLGQWLNGPGKAMAGLPAYASLQKLHQRFHDTACRYVTVTLGDSDNQSKREIAADFKDASADVIAAIDRLKVTVEAALQKTANSAQFAGAATPPTTTWDESLAIGLPAIDGHHRAITGILDKLMKNPDASLHSESAVDGLTDLSRILEIHFSIEEAYMRQLGMEQQEFAAHSQRHRELLDRLVEMNIASYANRDMKVRDIASQVRELAVNHVVEYDFNIKKYLHAQDVCHQQ